MRRKIRTNLKRLVKDGKASIIEVMKESAVRTQVHEIQDPSERLVATVGACMFNEPKYYPVDPQVRRDENGNIVGHTYCADDLDEQAQLIINTAMEVAESDSPRDLVAVAHWARKELKMRTTPQVLLAVAAEHPQTKPFVREYCGKVIQRPDEVKQVFTAYRSLYGTDHMLPNSLKRGLADRVAKLRESDFLKYEGQGRPTFADILKMIDRKKDWPVKKALRQYLETGEITDEKAIPVISARKKLHKCKTFGKTAQKLAKDSFATWEVLSSQFGNSAEMWEHLIDSDRLPPMAMMRNLRNVIKVGVSDNHLKMVAMKLIEHAAKGKQLPFRYLAAEKALTGEVDRYGYHTPSKPGKREQILIKAVRAALEEVVKNIDNIPGKTLVAVDNSGSMSSPVSQKSAMSLNDAATMLGAIAFKKSAKGSVCGAFGDKWRAAEVGERNSTMEIARQIAELKVGHSTNAEDVLKWAIKNRRKFDRVLVFSDMQTYGERASFSWWGRRDDNDNRSVKDLIRHYRETISPGCKLHCFDLSGHGKSVTEQADADTQLVAGFSERLLDLILRFEGLLKEQEDGEQEFAIEYIRENF